MKMLQQIQNFLLSAFLFLPFFIMFDKCGCHIFQPLLSVLCETTHLRQNLLTTSFMPEQGVSYLVVLKLQQVLHKVISKR